MFGNVECFVSLVRMTLRRSPSSKRVWQCYCLSSKGARAVLTTKVDFNYPRRGVESVGLDEAFGAP